MIASILGFLPWWGYGLIFGGGLGIAAFLGFFPVVLGFVKTLNEMLKIIPPILLAGLLLFALGAAGVERSQLSNLRKDFTAYKAQVVYDQQKLETERLREKFRQKELADAKTKKLQDEQNARIEKANAVAKKAVVDSANLDGTVVGLRDTITRLNGNNVPNYTIEEYKRDASTARGFLAECASEYSKVAKWAVGYYTDSLRN